MKSDEKKSQRQKILKALLKGDKLTTFQIFRRFKCVDGRARLSDINKTHRLKKEWVEKNKKRYLRYSIPI